MRFPTMNRRMNKRRIPPIAQLSRLQSGNGTRSSSTDAWNMNTDERRAPCDRNTIPSHIWTGVESMTCQPCSSPDRSSRRIQHSFHTCDALGYSSFEHHRTHRQNWPNYIWVQLSQGPLLCIPVHIIVLRAIRSACRIVNSHYTAGNTQGSS